MKKIIAVILAAATMAICFSGCGKEEKTEIDIKDTVNSISKECGLEEMVEASSDEVSSMYDFGNVEYKSLYSLRAQSPVAADEIVLVEVKSTDDIDKVKDVLKARAQSRSDNFGGYAPDESKKAQDAEVISKGNYVLLAICSDTSKATYTFKDAFKK